MNDVLIECFRAATETLNFTTAAQMIHISQPSFSRNIAMLEEEMGFKLFWRSKQNGIRLTPAGLSLYNGLFDIEKQYKALLEKSRQISRGEEGKLVIGILNGICLDSQTFYHIQRFREEYPQVDVELKSCSMLELETSLLKGACDISFMMSSLIKNHDEILFENVYSIPSCYVVPKSLGLDPEKVYSFKDLKDQVFLLSEDYPETAKYVIESCRQAGFEPKTKMAPDSETKMLWADLGEGVTGITYDHFLRNSRHVEFIRLKELKNLDFAICWNKDNYNPAIALFYSLIDEVKKTY
ncbi:MAG: LysR family transcriptional regulator [Lachnospiraceae bacterium]|nr:LysR family transcriptional regulator [Lachnospiraceae bacterium]